jgi:hypothetical protein
LRIRTRARPALRIKDGEDILKLAEWDKSRRLVALRREAKSDVALTRNSDDGQMELLLPGEDVE